MATEPDMPPYNPAALCPKCGHDTVATHWHRGLRWSESDYEYEGIPRRFFVDRDHLIRICQRCHFRWLEAPIGAEALAQETAS